ncbi:hypothetical protein [Pantoea agglomerans]
MMIAEKKCRLIKCIKEAPKKIKEKVIKIHLNFLAGFFYGAFTIFFVQWVAFSGHITPPGVSASVACMALAFTIYAAFKVKEWSDTKINEKAFNRTAEFLDYLAEASIDVVKLCFVLEKVKQCRYERYPVFKETLVEFKSYLTSLEDRIFKLNVYTNTFDHWRVDFIARKTYKSSIEDLEEALIQSHKILASLNYQENDYQKKRSPNQNDNQQNVVLHNFDDILNRANLTLRILKSHGEKGDAFEKLQHDDIFRFRKIKVTLYKASN